MSGFLDRLAMWLGAPPRETARPPVPAPAPAIDAPPMAAITPDDPRLPDACRAKVARLLSLIADIQARSAEEPLFVSARTEVAQMRDTHLPQLIESYADIPAAHRTDIFRRTGRSASYNLGAALDRMVARLEEVSRTMAQEHIDSFADNLRFIEHRYGSGGEPPH